VLAAVMMLAFVQPVSAQDSVVDKITKALPDKAPFQPKQPRKLLVFSRTPGYRHAAIAVGIKAITLMGDKTSAYTVHASENEAMFEPDKLKLFDAVLMLNTSGECLRPVGGDKESALKREEMLKKSLVDFVAAGKGLAGIHGATATYQDWKDYTRLMGGVFESHPWGIVAKAPVKNLDPTNPVNAAFGGKDFIINDEIYQFHNGTALPTERRFLLAIDTSKMDVTKGIRKDGLYPISWIANHGKGRNFYCSLGHQQEIYWNAAILRHYLAGIQFALGDLDANATATGERKKPG